MERRIDREWPWGMRCFYADDVEPPKRPGDLAIETRHRTESSCDMDVAAAESRPDIGRVDKFTRFRP